jgi:hypothetical protein
LVKVAGDVSRGFEDFTLSGHKCGTKNWAVWLELGGTTGSEVIYCCGVTANPVRDETLAVEGIPTTLQQDKLFNRFQSLTMKRRGYGKAKATLIGRFFSGTQRTFPGGTFWGGYGHMGFFSLLVVEQIVEIHR